MPEESPLERILSRLEGVEETSAGSYKALCPAHDDHDPSLSVTEGEDHKPLVHCFVCNDQEKVWRALEERGIRRSDLVRGNGTGSDLNGSKKPKRRMCLTGVYDYKTPDGEFVRHHSLRFEPPPKDEQHHPKCRGEHCYSNRKGSINNKYYTGATIYIRAVNIERDGEQYGTYYQAVRSYREQGKVKQEVIHLGEHQTSQSAMQAWEQAVGELEATRPKQAQKLKRSWSG
jgi:hypothetical protein